MRKKEDLTYTIRFNRSKRTYTIRKYINKVCVAKYRTLPQGCDYSENWTQSDIANYLAHAGDDYYAVY